MHSLPPVLFEQARSFSFNLPTCCLIDVVVPLFSNFFLFLFCLIGSRFGVVLKIGLFIAFRFPFFFLVRYSVSMGN